MYANGRMFRGAISKLSMRKRLVILASVGVFLPVVALTYMQYRSLAELELKTKGAFKDNLRQGLQIVERQMKQRLEGIGSETLSPIGSIQLSPDELEKHFANVKRSHPEIEEIFAFTSSDARDTNRYAYVYSDKFVKLDLAEFTSGQSYILSLFQKSRVDQGLIDGSRKFLFVYDSCTECPPTNTRQGAYLFYELIDPATGRQSDLAGVFFNKHFVTDDLLAGSIAKTLNIYHEETAPASDIAITITDENNQVYFSNAAAQTGFLLETNFNRPFSNWKVRLGLKHTNLDAIARNSFLQSAGATLLVLLLLLGGIILTIRATDREARLAEAKSNFVANVSHELKTPLSLLSLFSEMLELGRVKNEEKKIEYYQIIRHESRRLNKMIDNILDFSKIEAGRKTYKFVDSDMREVIDDVLSSYRYQIVNSGFEVQKNIPASLPPVLIDRDAMAQAISNLVDNAIKYSGKVKQLSITAEAHGPKLSVEIADQGIGISGVEQAKVFDKFYRVGDGMVHDVKGSGLGLSLVKHIIEAHQGSISVESEVGKGSRFTILLPLATER